MKKLKTLLILTICSLFFITSLFARSGKSVNSEMHPKAVYYFSLAMLNFYTKQYQTTEQFLLKAIEYDPQSIFLKYKMASFYFHFQKMDKAVKYCEETLLIKPDFSPAHELLANIYAISNNLKGAISEYKFLLEKNPDNPNLLIRYGVFLLKDEEFEKAKNTFRKLLNNDKYKAMAYFYLGKTYSKLRLFKDALKYYNEALKIKSDFQRAYYEMALVYQLQGDDKNAYETYLKVLKIDPDNILAREKVVRFLVKKNKLKEALKHLEKLKDLEGDNFNINIKLALIYMELKRYSKAEKILKKFNQFPKAQYYLVTVYLKEQRAEDAVEVLENIDTTSTFYFDSAVLVINYFIDEGDFSRALDIYVNVVSNLKEKNIKVYKFGLYLFSKAKQYKRGVEFIDEALERFPDVSEFYFYRGLFYDKLGDVNNVIKSMKKAIEINPKSADSLNYLAYTYAIHKINLKEAEKLAKKALNIKPSSAAITDTLGWIYYQMANYEEALNVLREAYRMNKGEEPEIVYHLAMAYLKSGDIKNAKILLNNALKKCKDTKLKNKILKALEEVK